MDLISLTKTNPQVVAMRLIEMLPGQYVALSQEKYQEFCQKTGRAMPYEQVEEMRQELVKTDYGVRLHFIGLIKKKDEMADYLKGMVDKVLVTDLTKKQTDVARNREDKWEEVANKYGYTRDEVRENQDLLFS